jgi:hypothetical protein
MTIVSSGLVGIGTTSPATALQVVKASESEIRATESTSGHHLAMYQQSATSYLIAGKTSGTPTQDLQIYTGGSTSMLIKANGNVGIGCTTPSQKLEVNGNVNIGGHLCATTKSFLIDNPTTGGKLRYSVVESDEHGVMVRGNTTNSKVDLPSEWGWLVEAGSVTVQVTPIGEDQQLFVKEQTNTHVCIGGLVGNCGYNYNIYGTRNDVEPLKVNIL